MEALGISVCFDTSVSEMLAACGEVKQYGARPLRREIFTKIEDVFSLWMLDGKLIPGDRVRIFAENDAIRFEKNE
jgi:ATP-dependent Clp protease ATP-binding subunit ClpA